MSELVKCPFCGGISTVRNADDGEWRTVYVGCERCRIYFLWPIRKDDTYPSEAFDDKVRARVEWLAEKWNTRVLSATDGQQADLSATDGQLGGEG